jgi:hypothetical protein
MRIQLIIFLTLISIKSFTQVNNWTVNVDLSKNGFLDNEKIFKRNDTIQFHIVQNEGGFEIRNFLQEIEENDFSKRRKIRLPMVFEKSNRKSILIWSDTKERITNNEYDVILIIDPNTFQVSLNGKLGVIDSTNKILVPIKYSHIHYSSPMEFNRRDKYDHDVYSSHENQLFICRLGELWLTGPGYDYIRRDGTLIFNDINGVDPQYFVKNKTIYSIYNLQGKIGIGKLWEKPTYFINSAISLRSFDFFNNPLLASITIDHISREKIINFETLPPIEMTDMIFRTSSFSTDFRKIYTEKGTYLVDKYFKPVIPKQNTFYDIDGFIPFNKEEIYGNLEEEGKFKMDLYLDAQVKSDSLLLVQKFKYDPYKSELPAYGVFKLGFGQYIGMKYEKIERINENLCIVTKFPKHSQNLLYLNTKLELFKDDYDYINLTGEDGVSQLNCVIDGKTQVFKLNDF